MTPKGNLKNLTFAHAARLGLLVFALNLAAGCAHLTPGKASGSSRPTAVAAEIVESATEKVFPALVRIHVVNAYYSEGRERKSQASGSGFVISPDGYVVTNHHVAGDSVRLMCTMSNREEILATLIGTDPMSDIALLKMEPTDKTRKFEFVKLGDSSKLRIGDPVLAMGSPLALSQSVTEGIVSNTAMTIPRRGGEFELDGENVGSIVRWIAHDAPIFPGNSGGPLVDLQGDVVGVNEISFGLGGAIPIDLAKGVIDQLKDDGEVDRAFFGFVFQPLFKQQENEKGVILGDVVKGSPAEKGGLKAGDRILTLKPRRGDPIELNIHFAEELPPVNLQLSRLSLTDPLAVTYLRDGKEQTATLNPVRREKVLRDQKEFKQWGVTGRNLSFWTALEMKRPDTDGLLVTSVRPGGPAGQARPALTGDDIILKIGDRKIKNMDEFSSATADLTREAEAPVPTLVTFMRDGQEVMTRVEIGLQELDDPGRDTRKSWIPIATQVLTKELAAGMGMPEQMGVRVTQLYGDKESSATLGLKVGDIIAAIDDFPIEASEPHDIEVFPTLVRQYRIGSDVVLHVIRDGQKIQLPGKLTGRPPQAREMKRYLDHDFNFTARDAAYLDMVQKQWKDLPKGAYIESVEQGGWTDLAGLQVGDLLTTIDGQAVDSAEAVQAQMEKIKETQPKSVIFQVRRDIHNMFLEIEPTWAKISKE